MELTVKDRLYIPTLLPQKGNFKQFNLKKEILRKIEISESERKELNLREDTESKRIVWDVEKDIPLSTDFSREELEYLSGCCEQISEDELHDEAWTVVEKIYNATQVDLDQNT